MVFIKPFKALHPLSDNAKKIACFPYDVSYIGEVREFVAENPRSFLRVTRPEADFAARVDPTSPEVLKTARVNFNTLIDGGYLVADTKESVYVYRLETETHVQTGFVACCSIAEYESGVIKKHERTQPDKVVDRTTHMVALRAQTGLILLAFRGSTATKEAAREASQTEPIFDFVDVNGIRHTAWRIEDSTAIVAAFQNIDSLYIADGHHRTESALQAREILRSKNGNKIGNEPYDFVIAGMFPADELRILPYDRIVKDMNGMSDDEFISEVRMRFKTEECSRDDVPVKGSIHMFLSGRWYALSLKEWPDDAEDPVDRLDVTVLQKHLLEPVLGIADPRVDERIGFVGGTNGKNVLEQMVNSGEAASAFALHATSMDEIFAVSDMGEIMPPKSTWFEPKLKDGLFVHTI